MSSDNQQEIERLREAQSRIRSVLGSYGQHQIDSKGNVRFWDKSTRTYGDAKPIQDLLDPGDRAIWNRFEVSWEPRTGVINTRKLNAHINSLRGFAPEDMSDRDPYASQKQPPAHKQTTDVLSREDWEKTLGDIKPSKGMYEEYIKSNKPVGIKEIMTVTSDIAKNYPGLKVGSRIATTDTGEKVVVNEDVKGSDKLYVKDIKKADIAGTLADIKAGQAAFEKNNIKLGDGQYISRTDWDKAQKAWASAGIAPEFTNIALTQGFDALNDAIQNYNKGQPAKVAKGKVVTPRVAQVGTAAFYQEPNKVVNFIKDIKSGLAKAGEFGAGYINKLKRVPTQGELKLQYEYESNRPLWQRLLLGTSVIKGPDKKYYQLLSGESPVAGGKSTVARGIATVAMSGERIATAADKWDDILSGIMRSKEALNKAKIAEKIASKLHGVSDYKMSNEYIYSQSYINELKSGSAAGKAASALLVKIPGAKISAELEPVISQPLPNIDDNSTPNKIEQFVSLVSLKAQTIPNYDAALKIAAIELAKAKAEYLPDTLAEAKAGTVVANALQTMKYPIADIEPISKLKLSPAEQALTLEAVQAASSTMKATQQRVASQTRKINRLEPLRQGSLRSLPLGKISTITKIPSPITTKPAKKLGPKKEILAPMLGQGKSKQSDKTKRAIIKARGGIAYRMGELKGKDVWDTFSPPYESEADYNTVVGKKPEGVGIIKRGEGSTYSTAQVTRGKAPDKTVTIDRGIVDIAVKPAGRRKVQLRITADPKQETTGDITIGGNSVRISKRMSRVSGGGLRISERMPKLK